MGRAKLEFITDFNTFTLLRQEVAYLIVKQRHSALI